MVRNILVVTNYVKYVVALSNAWKNKRAVIMIHYHKHLMSGSLAKIVGTPLLLWHITMNTIIIAYYIYHSYGSLIVLMISAGWLLVSLFAWLVIALEKDRHHYWFNREWITKLRTRMLYIHHHYYIITMTRYYIVLSQ